MPMLAATSGIGSRRALRAIWRSVGKVTAILLPPLVVVLGGARQHVLAPSLGRLDLVEREHVQARDLFVWSREVGQERVDETLGAVAAGLEHAHEPVGMAAQETRRIHD